ncbi:MAG: hypothetical protein II561_01490, partial [Thermoguttaceae bacterium]|nr:hypothetical protein [Thermoguttaceae bacterium]
LFGRLREKRTQRLVNRGIKRVGRAEHLFYGILRGGSKRKHFGNVGSPGPDCKRWMLLHRRNNGPQVDEWTTFRLAGDNIAALARS